MRPIIDRTGNRYGRWTVLYRTNNKHGRHYKWVCRCDCGVEREVSMNSLTKGDSKSCGCYKTDRAREFHTSHGMSYSRTYSIWENMKGRCYNDRGERTNRKYRDKGIKVCERWLESFENFYADMGDPPSDIHSIDRIDGDRDYSPDNCRWATPKEQGENWSASARARLI